MSWHLASPIPNHCHTGKKGYLHCFPSQHVPFPAPIVKVPPELDTSYPSTAPRGDTNLGSRLSPGPAPKGWETPTFPEQPAFLLIPAHQSRAKGMVVQKWITRYFIPPSLADEPSEFRVRGCLWLNWIKCVCSQDVLTDKSFSLPDWDATMMITQIFGVKWL